MVTQSLVIVTLFNLACAAAAHGQGAIPPIQGEPATVPNSAPGAALSPPEAKLPTLKVGDKAPPLSIAKWIRGKPVAKLDAGKVYVVEFWATWCPPCRKSISHLTDLQNRFKDSVKIVAVTSREPDGVEQVESFVQQNAERFGYTVAWDDAGKSDQAWMEASGQEGIPTAFVVDKSGRIAWIGHPMEDLDSTLESVIAGKFDLAKASEAARQQAQARVKAAPLLQKLDTQFQETRFEDAVKTLDQIIAIDGKVLGEYAILKFMTLGPNLHAYDRAYKYADESINGLLKDNPRLLSALAWAIVEHPALEQRNLEVAERAARRANEITTNNSSEALAALARVMLAKGDKDAAIELQSRAVQLETNRSLKEEYQGRLEQYRGGQSANPTSRKR